MLNLNPDFPGVAIVEFPHTISVSYLERLSTAIRQGSIDRKLVLDFKRTQWATPFALLMLSSLINEFKTMDPGAGVSCQNHSHLGYFGHMGFFWSFGEPIGNRPGEAPGSVDYVPINIMYSHQIREEAKRTGNAVGAIMDTQAEMLAKVLSRADGEDFQDTLAFSMREIFRNVVEHSDSQVVAFCAQYFPTKGYVEVGINDWGIGLARSLSENSQIDGIDDKDAIQLALMPGVSGKADVVKKLRQKDQWTNSGYGLYMTSRLCREGGSFLVGSRESKVLLSGELKQDGGWGFRGTAVRMIIRTDKIEALNPRLAQYRKQASRFIQKNSKIQVLSPSVASTALARDFS